MPTQKLRFNRCTLYKVPYQTALTLSVGPCEGQSENPSSTPSSGRVDIVDYHPEGVLYILLQLTEKSRLSKVISTSSSQLS